MKTLKSIMEKREHKKRISY